MLEIKTVKHVAEGNWQRVCDLKHYIFMCTAIMFLSACGSSNNGYSTSSSSGSSVQGCNIEAENSEPNDNYPINWASAELTVFNDKGAWTWFSDERVIVDADAGNVVLGVSANGDLLRDTGIEVVVHDLATGHGVKKTLGQLNYPSDQNSPGLVIIAPGEYLATFAHHNYDCNTYWSRYSNGSWSETEIFDWEAEALGCPWERIEITYNNPWKLSAEGRIYNFTRSVDSSPNFLVSEDNGRSWDYGGRLTDDPIEGYNAGYYKYWGNGVDRIDFFGTRTHPRDSNTSLYHGYIHDGKSYDSFGNVIDNNIFDNEAPQIMEFTPVFSAGETLAGVTLNHLWVLDLARYNDGTIATLWQGREKLCNKCREPGHHLGYSRFDGQSWTATWLAHGGRAIFRDITGFWEGDFLGGGALDPDDPNVIYISNNIDPRDGTMDHEINEIWKGETCDDATSFVWTPVTMNSEVDNLRPTVPAWNTQNTALLWFRGDYQTTVDYKAEVVGVLTRDE